MATKETKILQEAHPMIEGDGPRSYSRNSSYQRGVVDATKGLISECIADQLDMKYTYCNSSNTFRIADFGCSTGPNTFFAVENIIEAVKAKYPGQQHQDSPILEFQVFFNDLTGNDFNTLFRNLPSRQVYFAAGVPGSCYGRLFPESCLHFGHSSYVLHWLSKVPEDIADCKSPAWNRGSIHCTGLAKEVAKAYLAQFTNDMVAFLNARAQEMVSGGLMVIQIPGLPDGVLMSETGTGRLYNFLGSCLMDMAKLGVLGEEKVDSFNLPLYYTSAKELGEIIKTNGHFSIEILETWNHPMLLVVPNPESGASQFRAVFEGILKEHFGDEDTVNQIFNYFFNQLAETNFFSNRASHEQIEIFVVLKRKI